MDVCGTVSDLVPGGTRRSEHALRAVFNGLRYIVRTGNQWRFMPGDLPPWTVVYLRQLGPEERMESVRGLPRRGRPALERLLA
jgi:transposase